MRTPNTASRHRGRGTEQGGAFFRGLRVGPLAVALLAVIGVAVETDRRLKAEGTKRKA